MEGKRATRSEEISEAEIAERLQWLLRLRWLIVPVFVAVDLAYAILMSRRAPWVVIPSGVSRETEKEISALAETWSPHVDEIRLHPVVTYGNVENLTRIERYDGASARRPCPQVFDRLVIFWNGTATVCCADINGDLSVGHVDESGIKDLWNNARFSEIRRKHAHLDIGSLPICMKCDVTSAVHHRLKQEQLSRVKKEAAQVGFKF